MGGCCSAEANASAATSDDGEAGIKLSKMRKKERKRQLMEALAAEAKTNELLARIPGRMCRNGASSSVCIFTQQGRKGTNQDAMVAWQDYMSRSDTVFCGVFDGHGPYGHLVARRVRDSLPSKLASIWKTKMRGDNVLQEAGAAAELDLNLKWANSPEAATLKEAGTDEKSSDNNSLKGQEQFDDGVGMMYEKWRESFLEAFEAMDTDLHRHPSIDCFCSGTTAVTLLKQGEELVIGNVGDSRAVLATLSADDHHTLHAVQLTVDLKPNLPKEAERILKCKGRVFALEDEPEVARVWLPYDDAPGLAMARAFGDFCLKDFGLISMPEVTRRKLTPNDQFVVLATDGVWDVLSNKEVVDVVHGAPTRATAARALVEAAVRAWRLKYPNSKVDDCAVVCLYLHPSNAKPERGVPRCEPGSTEGAHVEGGQCEHSPEREEYKDGTMEDASFGRSNTLRAVNGGVLLSDPNEQKQTMELQVQTRAPTAAEGSHSVRSIGDCLSTADDDEWSALEGVVRVNSLLNLPRFLKGDKRASPSKTAN
ncbi:hypothetical protein GOP47_0000634 [Adiantum capillus-veneris]|uniref:PPM-type phosphatase domain-containing protein n=1 Tax=Adiantum capillus-veneris TaxID=13818 RepID=A0A9D4VDC9_ADICA|nr:hypothetical protein GOP47_0000634 [Adiantum capillus-veneris]